ncbi:MAG: restriction endonuclease subunit S, partial [Candidatus Competibacteraceae bacterium]|nr:restriction endonuclease subunit S [Candidatus Competibacteraceae bacterium]
MTTGYKQTEVGVIPEDWEVKSAHEFSAIKTGPFGTLLKASEYSESDGVPLISVGEIREGYLRITDHTPCVLEAITKRLPQYILRRGDIVFGRKGGVERSALIRQPQEGWFLGSDGISIRSHQDCHDEYLALQFRSTRVQSWLLKNAIGTTMPSLNQEILRNVVIPFPPTRTEQQAIAEVLSDADAFIESLEQLLAKKRHIKQGAMQELLTGKKRLPGFGGKWEVKRLDALGRWTGGMTPSMRNPDYWQSGTVPWISSGDVKSIKLISTTLAISDYAVKQKTTTLIPEKSIIVVVRSGILRKCLPVAMNMVSMAINQDIKALLPNADVLPEYVLQSLICNSDQILARCLKSGTTVESIEFPWFKAFTIPIPPFPEQTAI